MNIIKILFNKNTLLILIVSSIALTIYLQNNKIEKLKTESILKDESISELVSTVKTLQQNIKTNEKNINRQIDALQINIEEKIKHEREVSEKVLKESKRDLNKIFERKITFAEKEYNKHIKINIDKFNKGE